MIYIPFIYFSAIAVYLYRRDKKISVALIIAAIYAVSGLFTIVVNSSVGYERRVIDSIGFFSTFVYCFLLTIVLFPFINYPNIRIQRITPLSNEKLLKTMAWMAVIWFALTVFYSYDQFYSTITSDMGQLRKDVYEGKFENAWFSDVPILLRIFMLPINFVFGCSWIFIFLAFFSRFIQKLPLKFFFMFIFASFSGPWVAMLAVDRSAVAYWIISFTIIFFFFREFLDGGERKKMGIFMIVLFSLTGLYLLVLTVSRFSAGDFSDMSDSQNSVFAYWGMPFPYFCYFLENFDCDWKTLGLVFPFINKYLFGGITGGVPIQQHLNKLTNFETGVFYTFIGQIMISAGRIFALLYCVCISLLSSRLIRPFKNRSKEICCLTAYYYILTASVLFLGLFGYYYCNPTLTASVVFFIFLIKNMGGDRIHVTNNKRRGNETNIKNQIISARTPKDVGRT